MLSTMFIVKWVALLALVACTLCLMWIKRCIILKHRWSWKSRGHACGSRMGTFHLVTCDRCKEAHLEYKEWWEPNHEQPALR